MVNGTSGAVFSRYSRPSECSWRSGLRRVHGAHVRRSDVAYLVGRRGLTPETQHSEEEESNPVRGFAQLVRLGLGFMLVSDANSGSSEPRVPHTHARNHNQITRVEPVSGQVVARALPAHDLQGAKVAIEEATIYDPGVPIRCSLTDTAAAVTLFQRQDPCHGRSCLSHHSDIETTRSVREVSGFGWMPERPRAGRS